MKLSDFSIQRNGHYKVYDKKTGQLLLEKNYKNGLLDGPIKIFWGSGQLRLEGFYQQTHRTGLWKTFDKDGSIISEDYYDKNKITEEIINIYLCRCNTGLSSRRISTNRCNSNSK